MSKFYVGAFCVASIITIFAIIANILLDGDGINETQLSSIAAPKTEKLQELNNQTAQKNQWRQQISTLQQDLKKYQQNSNITQEISILSQIGVLSNELGEYPQAIKYLQLAQKKLNTSKLSTQEKSFIERELLVGLGTVYADQGNYPQVLEITRKISQSSSLLLGSLASDGKLAASTNQPLQPDARKDAQALYSIATTQQKRGKIPEALRTAEEALKILSDGQQENGKSEVNELINSLRQQL